MFATGENSPWSWSSEGLGLAASGSGLPSDSRESSANACLRGGTEVRIINALRLDRELQLGELPATSDIPKRNGTLAVELVWALGVGDQTGFARLDSVGKQDLSLFGEGQAEPVSAGIVGR